jgi:hypothetical protein
MFEFGFKFAEIFEFEVRIVAANIAVICPNPLYIPRAAAILGKFLEPPFSVQMLSQTVSFPKYLFLRVSVGRHGGFREAWWLSG